MAASEDEKAVELLDRKHVYTNAFITVVEARLRFRRADGQMSDDVTRLAVRQADAVGVLAYDPHADVVVLVRQFRYPVYDRLLEQASSTAAHAAWLLEIVAGLREEDQSAEDTARRELREETGYQVSGNLKQIATVYSSPGSVAEQLTLFIGEIDTAAQPSRGGGLAEEGEDTEVVALPVTEALAMLAGGEFHDAKTVIALQQLALQRATDTSAHVPTQRETYPSGP